MDERLVNYIKTEEAQGYTAPQLRSFLISKGYQSGPVDEAIRYAAQNNLHPSLGPEHAKAPMETNTHDFPKSAIAVATAQFLVGVWFLSLGVTVYVAALQFIALLPNPEELATWGNVPGVGILSSLSMPLFTIIFVVLLVLGLAHIGFSIGLYNFKKWGYWGSVTLAALACLSIVGIIPGVLFLLVLLHKKTKAALT